jgi:hypothetical protein
MRPTYFSAASVGELAMPTVALKRHVIVDYGLQLGHVGIEMRLELVMKPKVLTPLLITVVLAACNAEYNPTVVVDNSKVEDMAQYNIDREQCVSLAKTIDLNSEAATKALAGAAVGGVAVAGVATALVGAVFTPALPFIAGGAALGGGAMGSQVSAKEAKQRNKIFGECMRERGYRAYVPD